MSTNIVTKKKPIQSFPKQEQDTFKLLSFPNSKLDIMGTSSMHFKYASDIDLFDVVYVHEDLKKFISTVSKFFKDMVKAIQANNDLYFLDFICMTDDGDPLHWTAKDIKRGHTISNDWKHSMVDIFHEQNVIKIDIAQYIDGRFTAISNWYEFRFPNGIGINQEKETRDTPKSLREDIKRFYYEKRNYMKVLKRVFIIAQKDKNKKLINKLVSIFESDIGKLYKLKSEIGTMISVLENYSDAKTIERVKSSLQNIKQDSANTGFIFPQTYYNKYDKLLNYKTPRSLIPKLESIESYLLDKVNKLVMQEIKSKRIGLSKYI
jgi:hypothetical protein